eukprot:TRINITY_DN6851_c0_g2_i1.p1 TRINITY_DN6851_c0_g2~~TRINITY_DN6851_c0_g2_i1.p1  ORF type:complete len:863 (-),score=143.25 TRINITY_DN6851_c0_g2_i1:218-2806(-)
MSIPNTSRFAPGLGSTQVQTPGLTRGRSPNTAFGLPSPGTPGGHAFQENAAPNRVSHRRDCMSLVDDFSSRVSTGVASREVSREVSRTGTEPLPSSLGNVGAKMDDLQKKLLQSLDAARSDRLAYFTKVENTLMSMSKDLRLTIFQAAQQQPTLAEESIVKLQHYIEDKLHRLQDQMFSGLEERLSAMVHLPPSGPSENEPVLQVSSQKIAMDLAEQISLLTQKVQDIADAVQKLSGIEPALYPSGPPSALRPLGMALPEEVEHNTQSWPKPMGLQPTPRLVDSGVTDLNGCTTERHEVAADDMPAQLDMPPQLDLPALNGATGLTEEESQQLAADAMAAKLEMSSPNWENVDPHEGKVLDEVVRSVHASRALSRAVADMRKMDDNLEGLKVQSLDAVSFLKSDQQFKGMDADEQLQKELGSFGKFMALLNSFEEPERKGVLWDLVDHTIFEKCTIWIIVCNALFIIYGTNWAVKNLNQVPPASMLAVEALFTIYYIVELSLRILVHRAYFFINGESMWNNLDFALVALSVFDWSTRIFDMSSINLAFLRVVRLLKLAKGLRALKAVRFFNALRLIMDCMICSVVSFFWCVCFITAMFAIFSLIFVQGVTEKLAAADAGTDSSLSEDDIADFHSCFGSVQRSMLTLFMAATGGDDWSIFYGQLEKAGPLYAATFLMFICWFFLAAWNIVTGIFVEQAMKVAAPDKEQLAHEKEQQDAEDARGLGEILETCSEDGYIHVSDLQAGLEETRLVAWFNLHNLEIKDVQMFVQMLAAAQGSDQVSLEVVIAACMRLRGHSSAIDLQMLAYEQQVAMAFQKEFYVSVQQKMNWLIQGVSDCATFLEQPTHAASSRIALESTATNYGE